ncbi:type II glyceraldehyde-3-phosphate dehydrogenase [Paenibacillus sp. DR312]|uniref:type II glyceraldehyde-3-phosphate dehydrogenase n=1 Tax=Paenibacillus sp. DR312 TaxID=2871175 RepID=UPI001C94FEB3|nr:type II glyceraldehyde-3-phosphate dehydrogenase [Paenibacillus sp. DR312]QZN77686.1 type II glyceraldehyde-3-phosphate dehydrogenase [Paenibacillus sp. DR312]
MTLRVGVVGLGTIGKRVADAVLSQPDMELVGVGIRTPNPTALSVNWKGVKIYCTENERLPLFKECNLDVSGNLSDLLNEIDVVVDCAQAGEGIKRLSQYKAHGVYTIFQGGEKHDTTDFTFSTFGNYHQAYGRQAMRVSSCNTTGLVRLISVLDFHYKVLHVDGAIVRCSTDPDKAQNGIPNGIAPVFGVSHHGPDLQLVLPHISIYTQAAAAPMYYSHLQMISIELENPLTRLKIIETLNQYPRILIQTKQEAGVNTAQLFNSFNNSSRKRGDRPELFLWEESIQLVGNRLHLMTSIDMQCITIPETIDAIRAITGIEKDRDKCMILTDEALNIVKKESSYKIEVGI